jgi:peroxiredoxin
MTAVVLVARVVLAGVFLVAGVAKLLDPSRAQAFVAFGMPGRLALPTGVALPLAELGVAGALLPRTSAWAGGLVALALLLAFLAAISLNLARGRTPDCHCFGQFRLAPAGPATLLRNVVLAGMATLVIVRGAGSVGPSATAWVGQLSGVAWAGLAGGLGLTVVLTTGGLLVTGLLGQHGRLLLRIEALEAELAEHGIVLTTRQRDRPLGLPVGTAAPAFELRALDGSRVTLAGLGAPGKSVLLIFSDPACGPCRDLLPQVRDWQRQQADRVTLALVSRGSVEANRTQSSAQGVTNVLLQEDEEVAHAYEVPGTPGAVFIGPAANIASPVVIGAGAIERLVASAMRDPSQALPPGEASNGRAQPTTGQAGRAR